MRNAERKALGVLGLEADAKGAGGQDEVQGIGEAAPSRRQRRRPLLRGKLREIIQAYNYLKSIGFR